MAVCRFAPVRVAKEGAGFRDKTRKPDRAGSSAEVPRTTAGAVFVILSIYRANC
jgi:hypothetical protein